MRFDVVRSQRDRAAVMLERRLLAADQLEKSAQIVVRLRVVGVDGERSLERGDGLGPTAPYG